MSTRPANDLSDVQPDGFFTRGLAETDAEVFAGLAHELDREQNQIELIASENIVSKAVLEAQGSVFTNKYAEGYPGKRYYQGCAPSDEVETLAIERAKTLFNAGFANVQPHSGAQANGAVMLALVKPGDTILGMSLDAGGHLTHGAKAAMSGKWFNAVQFGVNPETHLIDFDEVERLAKEHRPKIIIAGGSAYPRIIDFARFRAIADEVGAIFHVDMAHFAGLVAGGVHPNPLEHAHVVTNTTHKTLRGPRGGMIMTNDEAIAKKINSAVFPGLQGGPLMHVIAAKAVAFGEALRPDFKTYAAATIANAKVLAATLHERGANLVSGGTDTHLALVDLTPLGISGRDADEALERAAITCNKNGIPNDPLPPVKTSGIRVGSPAGTTRGFGAVEFREIGHMISDVLEGLRQKGEHGDPAVEAEVRLRVRELCSRFPIYPS
ncbi:MAG: serine hydroxymethyltransferase [Sphingorhabdus sp.]|jgi:glycine hydroxymethyltransferase|uniref:serine hydroxymethyltransferase n=1 Tax=Sphingorhabdus sp. TaxID=1902408 RepID=UPI00273F0320|nr:serine hydroxymethyltransferase [Sphingorhabdus sp.]MCX7268416.1 serine hydroxymethyltransferase [Sphingomonadales bacterium]MDP4757783.1 serine hydroxymethyltransferase [Sphingorhabdus sp.]MDP4873421.1 serine hydroxymethyltransferase [Sphingorhabdus sp.]MDP4926776.1 serine hydroxymethyltransferase [Sphingorhabdus sp.]